MVTYIVFQEVVMLYSFFIVYGNTLKQLIFIEKVQLIKVNYCCQNKWHFIMNETKIMVLVQAVGLVL